MAPQHAPLFPRWADTVLRLAFAMFVGALFFGPALAMVWVRSAYTTGRADPIRQPIAFDHRHHVRDVGAECRFCHAKVETSRYAGLPETELCMGCHGQIWNDAGVLAKLRESAAKNEPIRWTRVHSLPDHVFFDHSIHVKRNVGCESCHGRVDLMSQVYQVQPLTMSWCLDCHRSPQRLAPDVDPKAHPPTNCTGCHR